MQDQENKQKITADKLPQIRVSQEVHDAISHMAIDQHTRNGAIVERAWRFYIGAENNSKIFSDKTHTIVEDKANLLTGNTPQPESLRIRCHKLITALLDTGSPTALAVVSAAADALSAVALLLGISAHERINADAIEKSVGELRERVLLHKGSSKKVGGDAGTKRVPIPHKNAG